VEAGISEVIGDQWLCLDPVRVGGFPCGLGAPDRFVTVTDGEDPILRVDVYAYPQDCFPFEDVLVWQDNLVIGFGSHVHVVAIANRASCTFALGSYYGHLYPTPDYLLIASGDRLFRMDADRTILWTSGFMAIDGVVVEDSGPPVIRGQAQHDPPGGWKPFSVSAVDGSAVR
jgi:hypothetical protein